MPYKIMLVDDEEEVRTSIIRKMDWEALGFHVVGDAENGEDALEKIHILDPDVIITDIHMPYMDGLQLAEIVKEKYPGKEVVIFSGYNDFEYAKQAMKCGVTEYILKPVNSEELGEILQRIREKRDKYLEQQRDIRILRENYRKNFPILKEKFLNDWMEEKIVKEEFYEKLEEYVPEIRDSDRWIVAMFCIEQEETVEGGAVVEEKELHQVSVEKVIDEYLTEKYPFARFICEKEIGVVIALSQEQTVNELLGVFDQIQKVCRQVFGLQISIGVGSRKQWIRQVPQSFMEAKEASGYRAVPDMGSVIYIRDVEPKKTETLIFEEQEKNALIHAVKFEQEEEIACELTKIIGRIADGKIYSRQCKSYVISVLNSILQVVWSNELEEQRIFEYGTDCYEQVLHMKTTEEVEQFLLKLCCEIHTQLVQRRENMTIDIIKEAKEYIQENYANPELSVEMLCSSLHLSPSYFSTVFKKETGQNYVAYLTDVRLNKAVELLNHTDDKTYIIAAKVGYPEPNYFSYVFKKKFGVSPSKYKGKS